MKKKKKVSTRKSKEFRLRESKVLNIIKEAKSIKTSDISEKSGLAQHTTCRICRSLVEKGRIIYHITNKNQVFYQITPVDQIKQEKQIAKENKDNMSVKIAKNLKKYRTLNNLHKEEVINHFTLLGFPESGKVIIGKEEDINLVITAEELFVAAEFYKTPVEVFFKW